MESSRWKYIAIIASAALATILIALLLVNIFQRKQEARQSYVAVTNLTEDTVEPAEWGKNFPREYDGFKMTAVTGPETRTRFGGSEAFQRLDQDPRLKRIFAGYAFGLDYRRVGTVHTTQGKEADVVIMVLGGGTAGARDWASSRPNLLNVAASRAKARFYVVGDRKDWSRRRFFDVLSKNLH